MPHRAGGRAADEQTGSGCPWVQKLVVHPIERSPGLADLTVAGAAMRELLRSLVVGTGRG